jgi:hypothetical protein
VGFRDVQGITDEALSRKLYDAKSKGFINYFGMQRYAALKSTLRSGTRLAALSHTRLPIQLNPTQPQVWDKHDRDAGDRARGAEGRL